MAIWAGGRKGSGPERPAWEWVSVCEPPPPHPAWRSPLHASFCLPLLLLLEGLKELFSWASPKLFFADISEIFLCKENIWTYFSLIGSFRGAREPTAAPPREGGKGGRALNGTLKVRNQPRFCP